MKGIRRAAIVFIISFLFDFTVEAQIWRRLGPFSDTKHIIEIELPSQIQYVVYAVDPGIGGVYKSDNGGISWAQKNHGLNIGDLNIAGSAFHARHIAIDPTSASILYVVVNGQYSFMSGPYSKIYKTTDGGEHWVLSIERLGQFPSYHDEAFHCVAIDPFDHSVVYASSAYQGVFKSLDGGATWAPSSNGLSGFETLDLAINPHQTTQIFAGTSNGVFMSLDSGATWTPTGLASASLQCLLITSNSSLTLYAGTATGIYKSEDGAATWTPVNSGLTDINVRALAADPENPSLLYAGTNSDGVYKSTNSGATWTAFNEGLWSQVVHCLAVDPNAPDRIYTGTENGIFSIIKAPILSVSRTKL